MRKGLLFTPPVRRRGFLLPQAKTQAKTFSIFNVALAICPKYLWELRNPIRAANRNERTEKNERHKTERRLCPQIRELSNMQTMLSIGQVAKKLSVSRSTVYRLIKAGRLKQFYVLSSPRISENEIERFVGCGK